MQSIVVNLLVSFCRQSKYMAFMLNSDIPLLQWSYRCILDYSSLFFLEVTPLSKFSDQLHSLGLQVCLWIVNQSSRADEKKLQREEGM